MINLTVDEIHFIKRQLVARSEWIKDNPHDDSIEEDELNCINSALQKLNKLEFLVEVEGE